MPRLATAFTPTSVMRKMHETRAEAKMAGGADTKPDSEQKDLENRSTGESMYLNLSTYTMTNFTVKTT